MKPPEDRSQAQADAPADAPTVPPANAADAPTQDFSPGPGATWQPSSLPARFGRYELRKLLGKGGMGAVYLAHDPNLDRLVALKIPTLAADATGEQAARFLREARAAATLSHPGICPVFDVGQIDGTLYLTMAFIEGEPLASLVGPSRPLPPERATRLVRDLALALQEAHDHGVIHRDLKPANVMLSRKGQPVIMDFGLARRGGVEDQTRLTRSGVVMGTPAYMSPEQVNGEVDRMGPATDVYALGVILYELLTGKLPFDGPLGALMAQILLDPPPPLSSPDRRFDPRLEAVVTKAMAKRPEDRFASSADLARELTRVLDAPGPELIETQEAPRAGPLDALPADPPVRKGSRSKTRTAKPSRARQPHSGKTWLLGCGGCLLAVVLTTGGMIYLASEGVRGVWGLIEKDFKRAQDFELTARMWRPPAADAGPDELFPRQVGHYTRAGQDDRVDLPFFEIQQQGQRATYRGFDGTVELYAYRKNDLESYALVSKAYKKVQVKDKDQSADGFRSVRGSPDAPPLIYSHRGAFASEGRHGVFWWKSGWLFHASSATVANPEEFLREYLVAVTAGPPPPAAPRGGK